MDGASQSNDAAPRRVQMIQDWMLTIVQDRGYEQYGELHIDKIDLGWKPREKWIEAGIEAFLLTVDLRDRNQLNFTVVLAYSLVSQRPLRATEIRTREELYSQLGSSPPSLYLFPKGDEPWSQSHIRKARGIADSIVVKALQPDLLGRGIGKEWNYLEFRQVNFDEWSRSIFVEG